MTNTLSHYLGTYKLKKVELQKEGFDINLTKDPIYFLKDEAYIRIDQHLLQQINDCKIRV